jgi:hypothetical protein
MSRDTLHLYRPIKHGNIPRTITRPTSHRRTRASHRPARNREPSIPGLHHLGIRPHFPTVCWNKYRIGIAGNRKECPRHLIAAAYSANDSLQGWLILVAHREYGRRWVFT